LMPKIQQAISGINSHSITGFRDKHAEY